MNNNEHNHRPLLLRLPQQRPQAHMVLANPVRDAATNPLPTPTTPRCSHTAASSALTTARIYRLLIESGRALSSGVPAWAVNKARQAMWQIHLLPKLRDRHVPRLESANWIPPSTCSRRDLILTLAEPHATDLVLVGKVLWVPTSRPFKLRSRKWVSDKEFPGRCAKVPTPRGTIAEPEFAFAEVKLSRT